MIEFENKSFSLLISGFSYWREEIHGEKLSKYECCLRLRSKKYQGITESIESLIRNSEDNYRKNSIYLMSENQVGNQVMAAMLATFNKPIVARAFWKTLIQNDNNFYEIREDPREDLLSHLLENLSSLNQEHAYQPGNEIYYTCISAWNAENRGVSLAKEIKRFSGEKPKFAR